jgi:hypothetical protein
MPRDGLSKPSVTQTMTIEAVLARLSALETVDGIALRGARTIDAGDPGADYDLLVLFTERPLHVTQWFTHIDQRIADVFLMDVQAYDHLLQGRRQLSPSSPEAIFMRKLPHAEIVHDRSGRMRRGLEAAGKSPAWFKAASYSTLYLLWFTQNFVLAHVKRMMHSADPTYLTAADMLMASSLGATYRAYFEVRGLHWDGEKGAIRYLEERDPAYLELLRGCLSSWDPRQKLLLYEQLVRLTLEPFGEVWHDGIVAVCCDAPIHELSDVAARVSLWEDLFE